MDLPTEPAYLTRALLDLDVFESINVSKEDTRRSEMYLQAQARRDFERSPTESRDLTSHLQSLAMTVAIGSATPFTIPRIAQLVNKTNQFNLTTRLYTEAQVRAMAEAIGAGRSPVSVADDSATSDSPVSRSFELMMMRGHRLFLFSCRVLGRGIECAVGAHHR